MATKVSGLTQLLKVEGPSDTRYYNKQGVSMKFRGDTIVIGDEFTEQVSVIALADFQDGNGVAITTAATIATYLGGLIGGALVSEGGALLIEHTATAADDHALEIIADAAGFGDVKAVDIDYITGAIATGADEGIILINIDETLSTGGTVAGLEVLSTAVGGATVDGMLTGVGVNPIKQLAGSFGNAASVLNNAVDVLTAVSVGGAGNISMFSANSDTVTIGFGTKFEELEIVVDTPSSKNIVPIFEYSTGVGTWGTFTPTDGTNGFLNTGLILWVDADIPTFAAGLNGEFLIRITRTRSGVATTPIVDLIQASSVTEHEWDKDGNIHVETLNAKTLKLTIAPAYADDTAAGVGGLTIGQVYQTSGTGAAPLNAAGILMIKQ